MAHEKTDASYGEKNQEESLEWQRSVDWQKIIGKSIISKDNLDMGKVIVDNDNDYNTSYQITIDYGDHERLRIPRETIYKIDKESVYTRLTENEILETRNVDPISTSIDEYTDD